MGSSRWVPATYAAKVNPLRVAWCSIPFYAVTGMQVYSKTLLVALIIVVVASAAAFSAMRQNVGRNQGIVLHAYLCSAASKAWREIIPIFEKETGIKVVAEYGASGTLLAHLEMSKAGDIYAPASPYYMRLAVRKDLVINSTVKPVVYLVPAILVPSGNPAHIENVYDLARPGVRVGLGNPESVAVGRYAKRMLEQLGIWDAVKKNVVVYARNIAELTSYVASGAVDAAITWQVNHWWYPNRTEIVWIPASIVKKTGVVYIPIGVTSFSKHPGAAKKFIDFVLHDPRALAIWRRYHYFTPQEAQEFLHGAQG